MIQQFSDVLRKQIREMMNDLADAMARGDFLTWDGYKQAVGKIHGLAEAEKMLLELTDKAIKGDSGE